MKTPVPEYALERYKSKSGEPIMKIIPEIIRSGWYYTYFEQGSVFAPRFNHLFQRIYQSGLRSTFKEKPKRWEPDDELENEEIRKILELLRHFFVAFFIFNGVNTIVFLFERYLPRNNFF